MICVANWILFVNRHRPEQCGISVFFFGGIVTQMSATLFAYKEEQILSRPVCLDQNSCLLTRTRLKSNTPFQSSGYASHALSRHLETCFMG